MVRKKSEKVAPPNTSYVPVPVLLEPIIPLKITWPAAARTEVGIRPQLVVARAFWLVVKTDRPVDIFEFSSAFCLGFLSDDISWQACDTPSEWSTLALRSTEDLVIVFVFHTAIFILEGVSQTSKGYTYLTLTCAFRVVQLPKSF